MCGKKLSLGKQSIDPVQTQLRLCLTIADVFTEIEHALILPDIFNFLLQIAQFVQTHLQVVQEVGHRVVQGIEIVDILMLNDLT